MAIDVTTEPGKTLKRLADALKSRQSRFETLTAYLDGNAPLPEGAEGFRSEYRAFQKKARSNFAEIIVQAPQERMSVRGFRVGGSPEFDAFAREVWSVNELDVYSSEVHGDMLGLAWGYAIVGEPGDDSIPVITREDPRQCITEHHPLYPSQVTAALKMYRDEAKGKDFAYLYLPGYCLVASRPTRGDAYAEHDVSRYDWDLDEMVNDGRLAVPVVPVVRFANHGPVSGTPMGEFEPHTDLLDRINYMNLQRLVITAMQAFRQRAILGELPETDEAGNKIDYGAIFRGGPGALWLTHRPMQGPDAISVWESQSTDIRPLLDALKDDLRDLAAATSTPMSTLMPDSTNQSAEGATLAREGLVFKTYDRMKRAGYGWNQVMRLAFMFAGKGTPNVETDWMSPELISLTSKADAWSKMADMPFPAKLRKIMQYDADEIARIEQERLGDTLNAALAAPLNNGV